MTPEPSDAVAVMVILPALSSSMVHLPPVDVSDWLTMLALDDPEVIENVTPRSSALDGEEVAVSVILSTNSPDEEPEMEIEVTGVVSASGSTTIKVMLPEFVVTVIVPVFEIVPETVLPERVRPNPSVTDSRPKLLIL